MFTASGLTVRFLKVFEKKDYSSVKWVRYLTKAEGSYKIWVSPGLPVVKTVLTFLVVLIVFIYGFSDIPWIAVY